MRKKTRVLLIYTGGTIGMAYNNDKESFSPLNFNYIKKAVPELSKINCELSFTSFETPVDSSNMTPDDWVKIGSTIYDAYEDYDGFVVLHGTDTMAYSASALSFMFNNLSKPIIFTGSQLPIGAIRNDARENLITSIEIASTKDSGIHEVCIFFDYQLFKGNRASKSHTGKFDAFTSFNFPSLAEIGIDIKYNEKYFQKKTNERLSFTRKFATAVGLLKLYPGIPEQIIKFSFNTNNCEILILETFGSGNAWTAGWFINPLKEAINKGLIVVAITQCRGGSVQLGRYETSQKLLEAGVINGKDMTIEAALKKAMVLLGNVKNKQEIKALMPTSLRGELTS